MKIRRLLSRFLSLFRARKADADLTREIDSHLQLLQDDYVAKGMPPEDARYAARRVFGGVDQTKESQRDARTFGWLAGWSIDLKLGLRMTRKWPGLTVIAVLALAVGICASATYMEFLNDLFRPKPWFAGADRLVGLLHWNLAKADVEDRSLYEFFAWKQQLTTVEDLGAGRGFAENLITGDGFSQPAPGYELSASAFRVVPIPPLYGRPLLDEDENPAAEPTVVIGEEVWKARFNSDPQIVGRRVRLGETLRTVVGVMPRSFGFPFNSTLWTPLQAEASKARPGEGSPIKMFGRLAPGVSVKQAQAELETIVSRMDAARTAAIAGAPSARASVHPFVEAFIVDFTRSRSAWNPIMALLYSINVFFIGLLSICAANVAQLTFARTATRESELTVRTALGASRGRIVAQLVAEALVLVSIAAVVGLVAASTVLQKLRELWNANETSPLPFWFDDRLSIEVIAYSALLALIAAFIIGGAPALKATGAQVNTRLKEAGATGSTMRFGKLWTGVIVTQVAVTAALLLVLAVSGWEAYTQNRRAGEVSFPRNEYLMASVNFDPEAPPERQQAVRAELQRRINEDPGIMNATFSELLPGEDLGSELWLQTSASRSGENSEAVQVRRVAIGENYFETFQQPLVAGRLFTKSEINEGAAVAIVDETFARLALGGKSPIGQLVRRSATEEDDEPAPWLEIIGVVRDVTRSANKSSADAVIYRPVAPADNEWRLFVHVRSNDAAARLISAASATDAAIRISGTISIERHAQRDAERAGYFLTALTIIALVTLMLAAAGIHSLISFTLANRVREIGVRSALGAAPRHILRAILSPTFLRVGVGIVMGSVAGAALALTMVSPDENFVFVAAAGVMLFIVAVATLSSIWPVRRALRMQPTEALRTT